MDNKLIKAIMDVSRECLYAGEKKVAKQLYDLAESLVKEKREKATGKKPIAAPKKSMKKKTKTQDFVYTGGGHCGGGGGCGR